MSAKAKIAKLNTKIAELQAEIAKLQPEADAELDLNLAVPGARIDATYGRGEKARSITGILKGVKNTEKASIYKIEVGEGADAEFINVFGSQITAITPVVAEVAGEVTAQ